MSDFFIPAEVSEAVLSSHAAMEETSDSSMASRKFACSACGAGAFYNPENGEVRGRATLLRCGE